MKREYKAPAAKKVDFTYDEQVVARSGDVWYCAWTRFISQVPFQCDKPEPWYDSTSFTVPEGV